MIYESWSCAAMRNRARRFLLVITLAGMCSLQGCATSLETLGLGVGIGIAGAVGLVTCAISCR